MHPCCPFLECLPQGPRDAEFSVCLIQASPANYIRLEIPNLLILRLR